MKLAHLLALITLARPIPTPIDKKDAELLLITGGSAVILGAIAHKAMPDTINYVVSTAMALPKKAVTSLTGSKVLAGESNALTGSSALGYNSLAAESRETLETASVRSLAMSESSETSSLRRLASSLERNSVREATWLKTATGTSKTEVQTAYFAEQQALHDLQLIPTKNPSQLRLLTYNVENLKKPDIVLKTIVKSDADVLVMQEVPTKQLKGTFDAEMKQNGFTHRAECSTLRKGALLSNVIYSRHPITQSNSYSMKDPYGNRCLVEGLIAVEGSTFVAFGTHLSNAGTELRANQMKMIAQLSEKRSAQGFTQHALMADMNTEKGAVTSKMGGTLMDSFDHEGIASPTATQWRGKRIDFILVPKGTQSANSQLVHSAGSDHIALMTDITKQTGVNPKTGLDRANAIFGDKHIDPFTKDALIIVGGGLAVSTGLGMSVEQQL
jgi:endonuclease/exonuclease/phosphatase family metal-dependent hydrolase